MEVHGGRSRSGMGRGAPSLAFSGFGFVIKYGCPLPLLLELRNSTKSYCNNFCSVFSTFKIPKLNPQTTIKMASERSAPYVAIRECCRAHALFLGD